MVARFLFVPVVAVVSGCWVLVLTRAARGVCAAESAAGSGVPPDRECRRIWTPAPKSRAAPGLCPQQTRKGSTDFRIAPENRRGARRLLYRKNTARFPATRASRQIYSAPIPAYVRSISESNFSASSRSGFISETMIPTRNAAGIEKMAGLFMGNGGADVM